LLSIAENEVLFALIGTTYGGDGQNTFAVPDLRGRVPVHQGQGPGLSSYAMAQTAGAESVTLGINQYPAHRHTVAANTASGTAAPAGGVLSGNGVSVYGTGAPSVAMAAQAIGVAPGGGQPHNNMAPSLGLNYIISLFGIFPQQT
jgi:microcystin-dependent protein